MLRHFNTEIRNKQIKNDAFLSPKLNPLEGPTMQGCEKLGLGARSRLPTLERGRGLCQKSRELDQEEIKLFGHEPASKTNTSWLEVILHALGVGTSHGLTWIHLTHHGPDSREATTFPLIVFSATPRGGYIQMALFPGTPKLESRNYPGLDSQDFGRS